MTPKASLQAALDSLHLTKRRRRSSRLTPLAGWLRTSDPPIALPLAHLTAARWFATVVGHGSLRPRDCKVFDQKLLYLSYGGVHYRAASHQTENATELPLAFLFDPSAISAVSDVYPFDSGAMASGRFGSSWSSRFSDFKDGFRVVLNGSADILCHLIYELYRDNERYLRGKADPSCLQKPDPFPDLFKFLSANLSRLEVDHRQRAVECLVRVELTLDRSLLWVAYPDALGLCIRNLYQWTKPWVPELYPYTWHRNFNPAHIAASLESEANNIVRRFLKLPK